ncbi:RsmB/NOP family class I SAM-dependent RNA methyltransferase [Jiella sp. MQZ9-1]|uniref:RsmB/NOP family class I SAM-dependent RNA methyltransferase n=1 Tax=Jiella flava TaxID=2816857 RepID=A0A939JS14_9HYPH|nr:RsmB/NOP family class I SAM-dependent RNA methyltransferase [Jiella flava]MBO0662493.1 RsmB/NOP family class I SAM-dependent RNA methyltransferase [Jiella flava]MCD2471718.1 RsmB/NOP family class I SAM-dependent RNA methyltransferase [Jiella flava]
MRLGGRLAAAIEVLGDVEARRRPVADALKDWGLSHRFAGSGDRAAIGNIVYDGLRKKRSFGFRMGDDSAAALGIAAVLEGLSMTPEALAAALAGDRFAPAIPPSERLAGFVAADLETASEAVRADVPDWLAGRLASGLGADWGVEAASLAERPPLDLRANPLKADRDKVLKALAPLGATPADLAPQGLRIAAIEGAGRHPNVQVEAGFQKGWFEVQDEGSQLAAALSGAKPGEQVLDLCAGAGGKTLALAAMMDNTGQIHATDADRQRLAPIHERLKRAGARNVQVHDPREDMAGLFGGMDLTLVDAPCTGSGTWRRRPDAKWRLTESALEKRMAEQDAVLDRAARFVRHGGRLVYVTCSLLAEENVERIAAFLQRHVDKGFTVADAGARWAAALSDNELERCRVTPLVGGSVLTMTPHRTGTDGFFFALLEKA